ncbi:MAG: hypothetical protein EXS39_01095 [Opitutaceae bacterium]|nr:hypothetical protein [Opitutaceae bacterium]
MWFKVLTFLLAVPALAKGLVGLVAPVPFYAWRQTHYSAPRIPGLVLIAPGLLVAVTVAAWYATLFHYVPWGWIITGLSTGTMLLAAVNLWHWPTHRARALRVVADPALCRRVDLTIITGSAGLLLFALLVY